MADRPIVLVFAGPNGSGKSTVTKGFNIIGEYINADEIKKQTACTDMEAAQHATALREYAVKTDLILLLKRSYLRIEMWSCLKRQRK